MARPSRRPSARHQYQRTDRIGEQIREIVATELERIGDERLDLVTVTDVTVDHDLNTAKVFYSALVAEAEDRADALDAGFEEVRHRVQRAVGRALTARKTPRVVFLPDEVLKAALRIEDIVAGRVAALSEISGERGAGNDDSESGGV